MRRSRNLIPKISDVTSNLEPRIAAATFVSPVLIGALTPTGGSPITIGGNSLAPANTVSPPPAQGTTMPPLYGQYPQLGVPIGQLDSEQTLQMLQSVNPSGGHSMTVTADAPVNTTLPPAIPPIQNTTP